VEDETDTHAEENSPLPRFAYQEAAASKHKSSGVETIRARSNNKTRGTYAPRDSDRKDSLLGDI